jgi:hypothetical protein
VRLYAPGSRAGGAGAPGTDAAQEDKAFMNKFIDVFYLPDVDPQTPYRCFVWQLDSIVDSAQLGDLDATAQWCKQHDLVARVHDPAVREELQLHGINTQAPMTRAVGD